MCAHVHCVRVCACVVRFTLRNWLAWLGFASLKPVRQTDRLGIQERVGPPVFRQNSFSRKPQCLWLLMNWVRRIHISKDNLLFLKSTNSRCYLHQPNTLHSYAVLFTSFVLLPGSFAVCSGLQTYFWVFLSTGKLWGALQSNYMCINRGT